MYGVRGLGLNCPGDAGCPGNVQPSADSGNVCDTTSAFFDASICNNLYVPKTAASSSSITATLNQYATPLMYAAGALLLLMMMKGRR